MIVVEGPDNSGKSTLISKLTQKLGLTLLDRPHGPPKDASELRKRIKDLEPQYNNKKAIIDRHPIIGESIYGPVLRNHNMLTSIKDYEILRKTFWTSDIFIIYCRPPMDKIMNMETHQVKDYDTPEHLRALKKNVVSIIDAYDLKMWLCQAHKYDYTKPGSLKNLLSIIRKDYLNERE